MDKLKEAEIRLRDIERLDSRKVENAVNSEAKRFKSFLHSKRLSNIKVSPDTVKLFLAFRSLKNSSKDAVRFDWMSASSLDSVRKKVAAYLDRKNYDPNPAQAAEVLQFMKLYQKKSIMEGKSTKLTEPVDPKLIDGALQFFANSPDNLSNEVHLAIAIAKQSGMRAGDILRLRGRDVRINTDTVTITPKEYKKARGNKSWSVTLNRTGGSDCPFIFLPDVTDDEALFSIKSTSQLNKLIASQSDKFGGTFTIHQVRVTVTLFLTAMGLADSEILAFMNWESEESLKRYRWGTDINELRGKTSLFSAWCLNEDEKSKGLVSRWVSKLKS